MTDNPEDHLDIPQAFPRMPEHEYDHLVSVIAREIVFAWHDDAPYCDNPDHHRPPPPVRAAIAALGVLEAHEYLSPPAFVDQDEDD